MHGIELLSPALTRDYSLKSFRAELKAILPKAGVQGTPICLLLEDHQAYMGSGRPPTHRTTYI